MSSNQKPRHNNRSRHSNKQNNRGRNQGSRGGHSGHKGPSNRPSQQPSSATNQIDSHGPTGKQRGNVKQLYDRYKELADECRTRDRQSSEAFGQFAHHYFTLYSEFTAADAAQEQAREKDKELKRQQEAKKQTNVVAINEEPAAEVPEKSETIATETIAVEDISFLKAPVEEKSEKAEKPRRPRKPKEKVEKKEPEPLELPLGDVDVEAKPKRKPAARKPGKVKEEVAE